MGMEKIWNCIHELRPVIFMVAIQVIIAGVNVMYKLAANSGMSLRVIVAYRFIFSAAFMVPLALIVERKRPKLTWIVLLQAFLCGLFGGSLYQNLYLQSLVLTSTTFVSAILNLAPAMTFLLAIPFGMEKVGLGTLPGKAKVLGTLIGIGGAMLLTFYKGVQLNISSTHLDLLHHRNQAIAGHHLASHNRALGASMALLSCISFALWLITLTKMSERYPWHYTNTALMSLMGAIQAVVFALCTEKNWSQWKLGWNIRLLTVAYGGILASGVTYLLVSWCARMRGPLYVSVFNPLMLVLVAFTGSLALEEKLYLGSILGAVLIVLGLYVFLWGKGREMKKMVALMPTTTFSETEPIEITATSFGSNNSSLKGFSKELEGKELNNGRDVKEEKADVETTSD